MAAIHEVTEIQPPEAPLGRTELELLPKERLTQCSTVWWRKEDLRNLADAERLVDIGAEAPNPMTDQPVGRSELG